METITNEYGRLEIKRSYIKNLRKGLEFAIILHLVLVGTYMLVSYINKLNAEGIQKPFEIKPPTFVDIDIPPSVNDENKPPEKPIEDITKPLKNLEALVPEPVAKRDAEIMTIKTQSELDKIMGNVSKDGDSVQYVYHGDGNTSKIDKQTDTKIDKNVQKNDNPDKNFNGSEVDVLPECINLEQVRSTIKYPELAIEIGKEGRVNVKVLVDTHGYVSEIGSITGPEIFYDAVKDNVMLLKFTPGLMSNNPVKVWVNVPFNFKLK